MSRRKIKLYRTTDKDYKFSSILVSKLINYVMLDGKKSVSCKIIYKSIENLSKKTGLNQTRIFRELINNIRPSVEIKSKKIGGGIYQIPIKVKINKSISLALKWIVKAARERKDVTNMKNKLYLEFLDSYLKKGGAFKKKEEVYKIAEANKAFSHYSW